MADQNRHDAITQFRNYLGQNITELGGTNDGSPTHILDGFVMPGAQIESRLPMMFCIEGPDSIDERTTPGRDISFELGLQWVMKDGLSGKSALQTGRDIEDKVIKYTFLAGANTLGDVFKTELLASKYPFVWPAIHESLQWRGRVVRITYRQET